MLTLFWAVHGYVFIITGAGLGVRTQRWR
jgi:hypothetical protein